MKNPQKGDIVLITGRRAKEIELGSRMTNNGLATLNKLEYTYFFITRVAFFALR